MKRIAAGLMIAGAGLLAGTAVVDAYPPGAATVEVSDDTPAAGGTFTVTVKNCNVGETVAVSFEGQTPSAVCAADATGASLIGMFIAATDAPGSAATDLTAPTAAGTYTGTATLSSTQRELSFSVTVEAAPSATLPGTGSNGSNSTLTIAGILFLVGAGMFLVAHYRRRETMTA